MTDPADGLAVYDMQGPFGAAAVLAPASLAAPVEEVSCFWDFAEALGARIGFRDPHDALIVSFPGWSGADCELARLPEGWLPLAPEPGVRWEDMDQGWYLATIEHGGWVYVFESDLDELMTRLQGTVVAAPGAAAGLVLVDGIEATWYRIPAPAFRDAWARAQGQARRIVAGRGGG